MGSNPSAALPKTVHLDVDGEVRKVVFSRLSSPSDVRDVLRAAAGPLRGAALSLLDQQGDSVSISPEMPPNTERSAYKVVVTSPKPSARLALVQRICVDIGLELSRHLKTEEVESEIRSKLSGLERRIEVESSRRWAIHKCQRDIEKLQEDLAESSHWMCISPDPTKSKRLIPRRDVPSYPKYTLSPETIEALKRPTFDIWQWAPNEMLSCIEYMFHGLGLVREFTIDGITLKRWLLNVQENYRDNPFHNWRHAFCVTQMMHGMVQLCGLQDHLSPTEILILMIAAVCHDLDHPGLNNTYQVNARTDIALRYGNQSPLERHHCAVTLEILSQDETNILSAMEPGASDEIQKGVMELILATDMASHQQIMASFTQCVENFNFLNPEHLRLLEKVLIKCCDTSNEVRPTQISEPWLDCLLQEYFMQADREKMEGLPVSPLMDPKKFSKARSQLTFLNSILIPMFESLTQIFPQVEATMVNPLREAREYYLQLEARRQLPAAPSEGSVAV